MSEWMRRMRTVGAAIALATLLAIGVPAAAQAAGEYEPNDTRDTAYGPLEGGKSYTATFETDNDVDWYVFYVRQYSQMDFSASWVDKPHPFSFAEMELRDADGKYLDSVALAAVNEVNHRHITLGTGRYYLQVPGGVDNNRTTGGRYRFRIDPASAITPSRECGEGIVARDAAAPELAKVQRQLAKNRKSLRKANRKVKRLSKQLRRLERRRAPSWRVRSVRQRLRAAKRARRNLRQKRKRLISLRDQHKAALTRSEAQIEKHC